MTASIAWATFHSSVKHRSPNRWQHRLKRERPTCTERNDSLLESANGSMATVATRREKNLFVSEKQRRMHLTPTGLLMEVRLITSLDELDVDDNVILGTANTALHHVIDV